MKILIACEFSGIVREAFKKQGHDSWSCDLLPTEIPGNHIQTDVRNILKDGWDMMIAHPPCTHLAVSGAKHFYRKYKEQEDALEFIWNLLEAPILKICVENPVGIISKQIRKPDQIIQPWMFGEIDSKRTCLWLSGLKRLKPTNIQETPVGGLWYNQTPSGQNNLGPSETRWKDRSRTYKGIAEAMAEQWG